MKRRCQERSPSIEPLEPRRLLTSAGQLDPSFGHHGRVLDPTFHVTSSLVPGVGRVYSSPMDQMAIAPDGKILIAGHARGSAIIKRYMADGSADKTFNGNGHLVIPLHAGAAGVSDLRVLDDGRIELTIAGMAARLLPSGQLDPSLDPGGALPGVATLSLPASADPRYTSVRIAPDGKFIFAASASPTLDGGPFYIGRLNLDGQPDASFGSDGVVTCHPDPRKNAQPSVTELADGTLFVWGSQVLLYATQIDPLLLRFDQQGNPLPPGSLAGLGQFSVEVLPWPGGTALVGGNMGYALIANDGSISPPVPLVDAYAGPKRSPWLQPQALDASGDVYEIGYLPPKTGWRATGFAIARYTPSGHLDQTFGDGGLVLLRFPATAHAAAQQMAFDPSGRLIVAGVAGGRLAMVRLLNTVGAGDTPDVTPPHPFLLSGPKSITRSQDSVSFSVEYLDDAPLDSNSLNNPALRLVGPHGDTIPPASVEWSALNGTFNALSFTYTFAGHSGPWSNRDDGGYSIELLGDQIRDAAGNAVPATMLGTFNVRIPDQERFARHGQTT